MASWTAKQRFRVGLLVVASSTLFVALLAFILGSSVSSDRRVYYIHFVENVKGMVVGSKVNFQGVPIGAVSDIRFHHGMSLVEVTVDPNKAVIQEETRARLDRLLVTGQVTIELGGFTPDAEELPAGSLIQPEMSPINELTRTLPQTVNDVGGLLADARELVFGLNELLGPPNRERLARILDNVDRASQSLPARVEAVLTEASQATASLRRAGDALTAVVEGEDVREMLQSSRRAAEKVERIEEELLALTRELSGVVGSSRRTWLEALVAARGTLEEFRALAQMLRLSPSALVFGRDLRELSAPVPQGGR